MSTATTASRKLSAEAGVPELVTIAPATYLAIEGVGSPGRAHFQRAIKAIYSVAYTIKMQMKVEGADFRVGALEALWWVEGPRAWRDTPRRAWRWKLLVKVPESVDAQLVKLTKDTLVNRRRLDAAADVRLERIEEGACVQALHVGPYASESQTLELMHAFMVESKLKPAGPHHEIYLSDPHRTAPERLRTLLRTPVS